MLLSKHLQQFVIAFKMMVIGVDKRYEIDFIESFRQSFSSISTRYRVEVPVSEIAYVFDYISVSASPAREERLGSSDLLLDE